MIVYRPFLNSDPPAIAEIWRSQSPEAFVQPVTAALLGDTVFAKPFFDRNGLIVAVEDDKPIGFVHAGFGPDEKRGTLDHSRGTTAMLLVMPREDRLEIGAELLARSETYLRERGASALFGGATQDLAPFYFGLYGGCRMSGVMASDMETAELFRIAGYKESAFARVMRRELAGFRAPVDRDLMQVRRQYQLVKQTETLAATWWEAASFATIERVEFVLLPKGQGRPVGVAKFWDIQPLASSWRIHAAGLVSLQVHQQSSVSTLAVASHFLSESLKQLQGFSVSLAEFHVQSDDSLLSDVCAQLSFKEVDHGLLFEKEIA